MTVELPQGARDLLDQAVPVVVTTLKKDGSPQSSVVWIERDGDDVLFSTTVGRAKERNLTRDPRASICFYDPANQYSYFSINGSVTMTQDGGAEQIDRLAHKYMGGPYPFDEGTDNVRVVVRLTPEHVVGQ